MSHQDNNANKQHTHLLATSGSYMKDSCAYLRGDLGVQHDLHFKTLHDGVTHCADLRSQFARADRSADDFEATPLDFVEALAEGVDAILGYHEKCFLRGTGRFSID